MDLLNKYLSDCSPYILDLKYDMGKREVVLVCVNNISEYLPRKRITFKQVKSFSEQMSDDVYDNNLIDSIIGLHKFSNDKYCVYTDKRELIIRVGMEPICETIE